MRSLTLIILVGVYPLCGAISQSVPYITPQMFTNLSMDARTSINLGTLMGQPFETSQYADFKGTAYFMDSFLNAALLLNDGKVYGGIKMRVNLASNNIHYLNNGGTELVAPKDVVRRVALLKQEADSAPLAIFSNNYPAVDNNDQLTYYQELCSGKAFFLKLTRKVLTQQQGLTVSPLNRQFSNHESWYVFANKKMEHWRKGREFVLFMLSDRQKEVEQFIDQQNLKCKSPGEMQKIVDWYNKL